MVIDQTRNPHDYNRPSSNKHPSSHDPQSLPSAKRHKTVSGPGPVEPTTVIPSTNEDEPRFIRQVHTETPPQRENPVNEAPVLEPTSTDKLIAGIWRQLYLPVQLTQ